MFTKHVSDVTENIAIHFKKAEILKQPTIRAFSRKGNSFSAKQAIRGGDNVIEFGFEYLGHNDGAVIEVWHNKTDDPCHSGEIKNVEITRLKEFEVSHPEGFYEALGLCLAFAVMLLWLWLDVRSRVIQTGEYWSEVVPIGVVSGGFIALLAWMMPRLFRYRVFPRWSRLKS